MKKFALLLVVLVLGALSVNMVSGQQACCQKDVPKTGDMVEHEMKMGSEMKMESGMMMGRQMIMKRGTMSCDMMSRDMGCCRIMMGPFDMEFGMMMRLVEGASFYLCCAEELGLSDAQIKELKSIETSCEKDAIKMCADLCIANLELRDALGKEDIDLTKVKELIKQIEGKRSEMQFKSIEASIKAKKVLNKEQLKKLKSLGIGLCKEKEKRSCCPR